MFTMRVPQKSRDYLGFQNLYDIILKYYSYKPTFSVVIDG